MVFHNTCIGTTFKMELLFGDIFSLFVVVILGTVAAFYLLNGRESVGNPTRLSREEINRRRQAHFQSSPDESDEDLSLMEKPLPSSETQPCENASTSKMFILSEEPPSSPPTTKDVFEVVVVEDEESFPAQSPDHFKLKISTDAHDEAIKSPSSCPKTVVSPRKAATRSVQHQLKSFISGLLQPGNLTPRISIVEITSTTGPMVSSSRVLKGSLMIQLNFTEEADQVKADSSVTLKQSVDCFGFTASSFLARDVLESCLPSTGRRNLPDSMHGLKQQLEWLNKLHCRCDPLSSFARDSVRLFETSTALSSLEEESESVLLGGALLEVFRGACVSLGAKLLIPHIQHEDPIERSALAEESDDLPPLFADDVVAETPIQGTGREDELADTLFEMMRGNILTGDFFCTLTEDSESVVRSVHARAVRDINAATSTPHNVFMRTDCDLFSAFPMSALDVLLAMAPALGRLLVQNVVAISVLKVTFSSTGKEIDGIDLMESFLFTDLFCITRALSLPTRLSLDSTPAAEAWAKALLSTDKDRLIAARVTDINRIVQRVRVVCFEIFKHALTASGSRGKMDLMNFFALIVSLVRVRTLGRMDDPKEVKLGFEPEGKVLSRHFVYGFTDLIIQLIASGGPRVFNGSTFLERRAEELKDVSLVQSLALGQLCKCHFDVYLLFVGVVMTANLERESLRQGYVMDAMRKVVQHSRHLLPEQKKQLEVHQHAYFLSSNCQAFRTESLENSGRVVDLFCQYLQHLVCSSAAAVDCFSFIEQSPHNLYTALCFVWSKLSRIRRPSADQVVAAERVVYVCSLLLNREDLLVDVKQQSHWVDILNSICGNVESIGDDVEFLDACLTEKDLAEPPGVNEAAGARGKWGLKSSSSPKAQEKSAYFGPRGPYVGAVFDSERNVRSLPVALARVYISCQSVEDWDADRDKSFNKFSLREKLGLLLSACINHPLHSEAVLQSLSAHQYTENDTLLVTLFDSAIDHSTSNMTFFIKRVEVAEGHKDIKNLYFLVSNAREGVAFLLKLCSERTVTENVAAKLGKHVLLLCHATALMRDSRVDLGLNGTLKFLETQVRRVTHCIAAIGGNEMLQVVVECCVDKGVRLCIEGDSTGLNTLVSERWEQEDAHRAHQQGELEADGDSDDPNFLVARVQEALGDSTFVARYHDAVSEICDVVESVSNIPGYKFEKIAVESRKKGVSSRQQGIMKAWNQVRKCLKSENGDNSFHPNGSIVIKYLDTDSSCARAVVSVNADTPYAFGLFFFDIWLPPDYPLIPPLFELVTTGGGSVMLSPNLYTCGKVCMSLLNTAQSSSDIERWQPGESTLAQVLLTVQASLLGDSEPLTKEGKPRGSPLSLAYNREKHFETLRWGMIDALAKGALHMGEEFGAFIACHFGQLREQVKAMARSWWLAGGKNDRLERVFIALLLELKKLPEFPVCDDNTGP